MLTIHVWPKRLKEFLLTHPLYKSPYANRRQTRCRPYPNLKVEDQGAMSVTYTL